MTEQARPPVRVTDPRASPGPATGRPGAERSAKGPVGPSRVRPADLAGTPREPAPPRRWRSAGAALLLILTLGVLAQNGPQPAEPPAEPLAEPVAARLQLAPGSTSGAVLDAAKTRATATLLVSLTNPGPEAVRITSAELGRLRFRGTTDIAPGGVEQVPLAAAVTCSWFADRPPSTTPWRPLRLDVATATGPVEVALEPDDLPVDALRTGVRSTCGYPAPAEAVELAAQARWAPPTAGGQPRAVEIGVTIGVRSLHPVRLLALDASPGTSVTLRDLAGDPVALPLALPRPEPGGVATHRLVAEVTVTGCDAIDRTGSGRPGAQALGSVGALLELDGEQVGPVRTAVNSAGALGRLVRESCAGRAAGFRLVP